MGLYAMILVFWMLSCGSSLKKKKKEKKMIAELYAKHVLIFRLNIWDWQYNYLHLENRDTEADKCLLLS